MNKYFFIKTTQNNLETSKFTLYLTAVLLQLIILCFFLTKLYSDCL